MSGYRDEFWHGEDDAVERDEAEMSRELSERYFRETGLRMITTQVRRFAKIAEASKSDAPRTSIPWRRG
jgi:hypothetical protein